MKRTMNREGGGVEPGQETKVTLRLSGATSDILKELFPDLGNVTAQTTELMAWGAAMLLQGVRSGLSKLDSDERLSIIGTVNGLLPIPLEVSSSGPALGYDVKDFFTIGDGAFWGWREDKISALIERLTAMNPIEAAGLVCWGVKAWRLYGEQDSAEFMKEYAQTGGPFLKGSPTREWMSPE
jgi:hypothetical protein